MIKLAWDSNFHRAFKHHARKNPHLENKVLDVLERLSINPSDPLLKTHKLKGKLEGLWSCWVEYDFRILFTFAISPQTSEEYILLIDLGKHDEVY